MEPKIEITIDNKGNPILKFTHDQTSKHVQQKLLDVFKKKKKKEGLRIVNPTGCAGSDKFGKQIRYECYEVILGKDNRGKKTWFQKLKFWSK